MKKLHIYFLCLFAHFASADENRAELGRFPIPRAPGFITIDVKVFEEQVTFLFDTGSTKIGLDSSIPKDKLRATGMSNFRDGRAGAKTGMLYQLPTIMAQGLKVERPEGFLSDFRGISLGIGQKLSGIVGLSDLGSVKVCLDYKDSVLVVHQGEWSLQSADVTEVGLRNDASSGSLDSQLVIFEAEIEGEGCAFIVDSGDNGCVNLPFNIFERLVQKGVIRPSEQTGRTISALGTTRNQRGWFLKGRLMGRELAGVTVTSSQLGILGLGWLCGFQTEIDRNESKIRYRAIDHPRPPISVHRMLGAILFYRDGQQVIESLQPGGLGLAERVGVKVGDIIHEFGSAKGNITGNEVIDIVEANVGGRIPVKLYRSVDKKYVDVALEIPELISDWDFAGLPHRPSK